MAYAGSQPIYILSEGSRRTSGRDAQSMNVTAGRAVAEAVELLLRIDDVVAAGDLKKGGDEFDEMEF